MKNFMILFTMKTIGENIILNENKFGDYMNKSLNTIFIIFMLFVINCDNSIEPKSQNENDTEVLILNNVQADTIVGEIIQSGSRNSGILLSENCLKFYSDGISASSLTGYLGGIDLQGLLNVTGELIIHNWLETDIIKEKNSNSGVLIEGVLLKDNYIQSPAGYKSQNGMIIIPAIINSNISQGGIGYQDNKLVTTGYVDKEIQLLKDEIKKLKEEINELKNNN